MRTLFIFLMATCAAALADDLVYSSLPDAARRTVEANRGTGTVIHVEAFDWGKARIFRVEIGVDGMPAKEIQVADSGKLIRMDDLRPLPEEPNETDDRPSGKQGD